MIAYMPWDKLTVFMTSFQNTYEHRRAGGLSNVLYKVPNQAPAVKVLSTTSSQSLF